MQGISTRAETNYSQFICYRTRNVEELSLAMAKKNVKGPVKKGVYVYILSSKIRAFLRRPESESDGKIDFCLSNLNAMCRNYKQV